ncbi:MAG: hypothetical protein ACP5PA_04800 [Elusimicrobiales bacterium]
MSLKEMIISRLNNLKKQSNTAKTTDRWKNITNANAKLITYYLMMTG